MRIAYCIHSFKILPRLSANFYAKKLHLHRFILIIMAGIYLHIPFCKKACHYCNFYFSTSLKAKDEMMNAMIKEIQLRKQYLKGEVIESIYFGGGTPSLLTGQELGRLIDVLQKEFNINDQCEWTLEANPDDIDKAKLKEFISLGINRLSIGVQSFFEEDLLFMNRSHQASQAEACIRDAQSVGMYNLSIDLIFGYPLLSHHKWEQNMNKAIELNIPHLSCYAMTVEPRTALATMIQQKKLPPIINEQSATQFHMVMNKLQAANYEHYEISNYAFKGWRAVHNSNYWKGVAYLGIGPSAHSFNGVGRQWNVSNNALYIKSLLANQLPLEEEILTRTQQLNERIMISLRTIEGLELLSFMEQLTTTEQKIMNHQIQQLMKEGLIDEAKNVIQLTQEGKLMADYIAAELFLSKAK